MQQFIRKSLSLINSGRDPPFKVGMRVYMRLLTCWIYVAFYIINFSLAFCKEAFNEGIFGILKPLGSFWVPIKVSIPFCLFHLGTPECTSEMILSN